MKPRSSYINICHSLGKFHSLTSTTADLQNEVLAFVGDRKLSREPTVVALPPQKTWEWPTLRILMNLLKLMEWYEDEDKRGKLWTHSEDNSELTEHTLPRLLAIPT